MAIIMKQNIDEIKTKIIPVLKHYDVTKAGIFGSFARGDFTKKSDLDILVEFKKGKSLLDLARLELELEEKIKRNVEIITYNSLNPLIKKQVLKEEVEIL